ncbi:MAG TPA: peptidoglycan endopeptidase, partial [Saprospiraceae bacterium]|nr:peptidoglycan endopeptidase [Saprospiraceae bacterium]
TMAITYPINESTNTYSVREPIPYQSNVRINDIPDPVMVSNDVETKAKRLLSIKYVWGATGPYTYDCSGFTQKIYRDAGINIPRVSRDQAREGQYVSYENLRRGDMVFFDTKKKRTGIVSHVGIYLGNNNFIHASSAAKKIVIYNFNEKSFYKKRFLWGRRVIRDNYYMASL